LSATPSQPVQFRGNDRLLCGIILGVTTFWLFAQTTLNIAPDMGRDLRLGASTMNIAVALTALFSGIFIGSPEPASCRRAWHW
jgi:DHA2 family multidrug resistance protein-like MFS transporter